MTRLSLSVYVVQLIPCYKFITEKLVFFISNFRLVLYVVCFLLGNSPASECYMPTFRNTLFHLHRQVGKVGTYLPMKMEQTECSETSAYKIQTPGNYPEENIQHVYLSTRFQQPLAHPQEDNCINTTSDIISLC